MRSSVQIYDGHRPAMQLTWEAWSFLRMPRCYLLHSHTCTLNMKRIECTLWREITHRLWWQLMAGGVESCTRQGIISTMHLFIWIYHYECNNVLSAPLTEFQASLLGQSTFMKKNHTKYNIFFETTLCLTMILFLYIFSHILSINGYK